MAGRHERDLYGSVFIAETMTFYHSALKILSFVIALFPLATPAVGSSLHKQCKFKQAIHLQFSSETRTQTCGNVTLLLIFSTFWLLPEKNTM